MIRTCTGKSDLGPDGHMRGPLGRDCARSSGGTKVRRKSRSRWGPIRSGTSFSAWAEVVDRAVPEGRKLEMERERAMPAKERADWSAAITTAKRPEPPAQPIQIPRRPNRSAGATSRRSASASSRPSSRRDRGRTPDGSTCAGNRSRTSRMAGGSGQCQTASRDEPAGRVGQRRRPTTRAAGRVGGRHAQAKLLLLARDRPAPAPRGRNRSARVGRTHRPRPPAADACRPAPSRRVAARPPGTLAARVSTPVTAAPGRRRTVASRHRPRKNGNA